MTVAELMREIHREDIATAYLHAAAAVVTSEINGNRELTRPELALVAAAQRCRVPLRHAVPFLREPFGFTDEEFAAWQAALEPVASAFVLRALAHAIHERDI